MALINRYRYLQAIFIGLPIGILALYFGIDALLDAHKRDLESYPHITGVVYEIKDTTLVDKEEKKYIDITELVLCNIKYYTRITKNRNRLKLYVNKRDTVNLYYNTEEGRNMIQALYLGDFNVIEPSKGYWVGIVFIILGLFLTVISFLYMIKHPSDLKG